MRGELVLFQRFVAESAGRDVRVYVVDGQVVAAMGRVNLTGDFAPMWKTAASRCGTPSPRGRES